MAKATIAARYEDQEIVVLKIFTAINFGTK